MSTDTLRRVFDEIGLAIAGIEASGNSVEPERDCLRAVGKIREKWLTGAAQMPSHDTSRGTDITPQYPGSEASDSSGSVGYPEASHVIARLQYALDTWASGLTNLAKEHIVETTREALQFTSQEPKE